jgi:hypothetical protein
MKKNIKVIVLSILGLLILTLFFFLIISGGFIMRNIPSVENTQNEKLLINTWKKKGFIFGINHSSESQSGYNKLILITLSGNRPLNKDSLSVIIDSLHSQILSSMNPKYKYDSIHYILRKVVPNESYDLNHPNDTSPTKSEEMFKKSYKGNI